MSIVLIMKYVNEARNISIDLCNLTVQVNLHQTYSKFVYMNIKADKILSENLLFPILKL